MFPFPRLLFSVDAPSAELELGRNLNADAIVEGNDVYFECRIRSNPSPTRVTWTLEVTTLASLIYLI